MRKILETIFLVIIVLGVSGILVACSGGNETPASSENGQDNIEPIVNAVQFAGLSEKDLIELIGEPESRDEWNFDSPNGQTYKAVTLTYDNGNQEFLFIDGKVVRFTFYGTGQTYENEDQALALFGIEPGDQLEKVEDTGSAFRYRQVDEEKKIEEFWLMDDLSSDNQIGTVKITYDLRYFE